MLERTERGDADVAESMAASNMWTGSDPTTFAASTSAASNVHPNTRQNPFLDEEGNSYRLATGRRHRSERSVADVNNPGKTRLIVGYPFMGFKPEMPYTNSLYQKSVGGRTIQCREEFSLQRESIDHI